MGMVIGSHSQINEECIWPMYMETTSAKKRSCFGLGFGYSSIMILGKQAPRPVVFEETTTPFPWHGAPHQVLRSSQTMQSDLNSFPNDWRWWETAIFLKKWLILAGRWWGIHLGLESPPRSRGWNNELAKRFDEVHLLRTMTKMTILFKIVLHHPAKAPSSFAYTVIRCFYQHIHNQNNY